VSIKQIYSAPSFSSGSFEPPAHNTYDLGTGANAWRDAYVERKVLVGDGGIVDFNDADVTITHSANLLTLAGGSLRLANSLLTTYGTTDGTDWDMYHDGSDMYMQKNTGGLMIALSGTPPAPDRDVVHIWNGTSGSGDPPSDRADLIIEDNSHVGIALLCPNTDTGFIYFADEDDIDIGQIAYDHNTERMQLRAGNTTGLLITGVGNIQIGDNSVRGTTVGTNTLEIFNGTEPAGTLSNGCSLYSKGGEMFVMAADGGTGSQISPHDRDGYWIFNGGSGKTRKRMKVKMELLMRRLNDEFGGGYIEDCEGED